MHKHPTVAKQERKPISLNPLKFEEAVSNLLKVKPEPKTAKKKRKEKPDRKHHSGR